MSMVNELKVETWANYGMQELVLAEGLEVTESLPLEGGS